MSKVSDLLKTLLPPDADSNTAINLFYSTTRKKTSKKPSARSPKSLGNIKQDKICYRSTFSYQLAKKFHEEWKTYFRSNVNMVALQKQAENEGVPLETLSLPLKKGNLIGAKVYISKAKNECLAGIKGIVLQESQNTFVIVTKANKTRIIPKTGCEFTFQFENLNFCFYGSHLRANASERALKKTKNSLIPLELR